MRIKRYNTKLFLRLWMPAIIYAALIFWISSSERPFGVEVELGNLDKLIHFLEFSVFGFLLIRAICGSDAAISRRTAIISVFLIGSFYGLTDEIHQAIIPGRVAAVSDFIFDSIGSLAGAVIFTK